MNFWLGAGIVVIAIGLIFIGIGVALDRDLVAFAGFGLCGAAIVGMLLWLGVAIMTGNYENPLIEGKCYRAVSQFNGKTYSVVPKEIACP